MIIAIEIKNHGGFTNYISEKLIEAVALVPVSKLEVVTLIFFRTCAINQAKAKSKIQIMKSELPKAFGMLWA